MLRSMGPAFSRLPLSSASVSNFHLKELFQLQPKMRGDASLSPSVGR